MSKSIEARVELAATAHVQKEQSVSPVDVLIAIGWLHPNHVEWWRKGRTPFLEQEFQVDASRVDKALNALRNWAIAQGLVPVETNYERKSHQGLEPLRFTADGNTVRELAFRTHWVSKDLSSKAKAKLEKKAAPSDPVVFQIIRESECTECGEAIDQGDMLWMEADKPLCLACANLADLVYLESGDATLTRRASKLSARKAVVVRFSRSRGRYERQGILVEESALAEAEASCAEDAPQRAAARARDKKRREQEDQIFALRMAGRILELFPGCPPEEAQRIATFTATRGSGRVGRSAAGKRLDDRALTLAVRASIRHNHTPYDNLLAQGIPRETARERVLKTVDRTAEQWQKISPN